MKWLISLFVYDEGKVMVHCKVGASRSATIVLAFLMIKRHMTIQEAVRMVRARREIVPNDGFLQQLCEFNEKLHHAGHFAAKTDTTCSSWYTHKAESDFTHSIYIDCSSHQKIEMNYEYFYTCLLSK